MRLDQISALVEFFYSHVDFVKFKPDLITFLESVQIAKLRDHYCLKYCSHYCLAVYSFVVIQVIIKID